MFTADVAQKRTFDDVRGYELLPAGGGPEHKNFILSGPAFHYRFSGSIGSEPVPGVDQSLHASLSKVLIWYVFNMSKLVQGWTIDETRQLITEALTAYKAAHGYPEGQAVRVVFGMSPNI